MTYREAWEQMRAALASIYPEQEASAICREVFLRLLQMPPDQRVLNANETLPRKSIEQLHLALNELKTGKPVQYVTGICDFLGLELKVEPGVLIPRPETEELVLWATSELESIAPQRPAAVIDIGTGSGCIALSLAKRLPMASISACDVSPEALKVANENARLNKVEIEFFACDILHEAMVNENFKKHSYDCMVSNPPYVRHSEKKWMRHNVLNFEPSLALFVDDSDPLLFYKAIGELALHALKPGGLLFFEINESLSEETSELLTQMGYTNIEIRSDLFGKPRFIKAQNTSINFRP